MTAAITRLLLSNWRNFKKVDVELGERVFIVGPNASGKSNLLDALRFLRDIATPGGSLVRAVDDRRGLKHLRSLHAGFDSNVVVSVEVRVRPDGQDAANAAEPVWSYTLEIAGRETKQKPLRIVREVIRHGGVEVLTRSLEKASDERLFTQTHLEQISQSLKFRPLADALASIEVVHVVPQVSRTPTRAEEFARREAPGSDFIDQVARLGDRKRTRSLRRIEKLLRLAVPRFSQLRTERDELGKPHLEAKYEHWRRRGGWQNEQEFSDGTLRLVGLLWAIDKNSAPLLLEEPELSLHRDVIRQLPRLITQAAQRSGRQVMIATHADEMVSDRGIAPAEILILEPSEHETKVVVGDTRPELVNASRAGLSLGRIVSSLTRPNKIEQLSLPAAD